MEWFKREGNHSDIVLFSKVTKNRNITAFPFCHRLSGEQKNDLAEKIEGDFSGDDFETIALDKISQMEAISLVEKFYIDATAGTEPNGKVLLIKKDRESNILIGDEDHVKITTILPGLDLNSALLKSNVLDDELSKKEDVAFNDELGYLTSDPQNVGTAMRASVCLHLPALVRAGGLRRISTSLSSLGLSLRACYLDNGKAIGDVFELKNTVTLGISENDAVKNLTSITEQIIAKEDAARKAILNDSAAIDSCLRSAGVLNSAYMLSSSELISLISLVRLGISLNKIDLSFAKMTEILIMMQPATMCASSENCTRENRRLVRAERVKNMIK